jgi:DNA-binding transcriptional MocR family regulator
MAWQSLALGPRRATTDGLAALTLVAPVRAGLLNLGYLPEELQATTLLAAAAARAMRRPGLWGRMPIEGIEGLRTWFADATGGAFAAHEVTICPGSQAANAAALRALAAPGDPVLMESPTYAGAIAAAQMAGLRIIPVPTDTDGVRPDLLADAFRRSGARLFYCQPTCANPTGAVLSPSRRAEVVEVVTRAGAFLIEDDWAHDFYLEGTPPPPLASAARDGHVVYVRSLTKCAAPGLRIGAICARGAALERLRTARLVDDFFVPGIMQETALQLVTATAWPRHLRGLRAALRERRDLLVQAVRSRLGAESLPLVPAGGINLWVRLPEGISDQDVVQAAARRNVLVSAGRHCFPAEPPATYLRLSFATVQNEWVDEAVQVLAEAVAAPATR